KLSWCAVQAICEYVLPGPSPGTPTFFNNMDGCNGMWEDIIPACLVPVEEENLEKEILAIFPNPAHNELNLVLPENTREGILTIFDLAGRQLKTMYTIPGTNTFDVSDLPKGIFLIEVRFGDQVVMGKFVRQ
ncbi:MAG: T9SS type A sorting domain-containing protein, partial [Saprospiraceae bacterium]|nr:T9SS type A sorting domain-containing protein [Saprospiraceae bacterium]MDZ4705273.1 T9SS type A sorting domain-containing protein [Saprospiraceae bacterium]